VVSRGFQEDELSRYPKMHPALLGEGASADRAIEEVTNRTALA
jgi:hypothetical protein